MPDNPEPTTPQATTETLEYRLVARNTATSSDNKIHDNEVAQRLGFRGGLVPGVDLFAYLCHLPVSVHGVGWLRDGRIAARFSRPVYEGDEVRIELDPPDDRQQRGERLGTPQHDLCASALTAPVSTSPAKDVPAAPLATDPRPPASPESLRAGTVLGALHFGFHADKAEAYLDEIGESLAIYRDEAIAHPGWLLRFANFVLATHFELGPWIHTSSDVCFHGTVDDGDHVECRARVAQEYERNGHRLVDLDVLLVADGDRPVMSVDHTAIYRPRQALGATETR